MNTSKYATYDYAGLFRCCATAIPVTPEMNRVLAGEEGEYRPCPHGCENSGVRFRDGVWRASTDSRP